MQQQQRGSGCGCGSLAEAWHGTPSLLGLVVAGSHLVNLMDKVLAETSGDLDVCYVDHVLVDEEVDVVGGHAVAVKGRAGGPDELVGLVLVAVQVGAEGLRVKLEERGQLCDGHCAVELQVAADGRQQGLLPDLLKEELELQVVGLLVVVGARLVVVRRNRAEELRAAVLEQLLIGRLLAALDALHAVAALLKELLVDALVDALRADRHGDGEQVQQLVAALDQHLKAGRARVQVLRLEDVVENVGKTAHSVLVAAHHEVGKADVVEDGDLAGRHAGEEALLVELNVLHNLQCLVVVAKQGVQAEETDQAEVAKHLVQGLGAKLAGNLVGIAAFAHGLELGRDVRLVDERVQHVEHNVDVPHLRVLAQGGDLLGCAGGQLGTELRKGLELVDELVDDVPQPAVRQLKIHGRLGVKNIVEEVTVVLVGLKVVVKRRLQLGVDVAEVELLVEREEPQVVVDERGDRLGRRPGLVLEVAVCQTTEVALVDGLHLVGVRVVQVALEVQDKVLHGLRQDVRGDVCAIVAAARLKVAVLLKVGQTVGIDLVAVVLLVAGVVHG
eukprot:m.70404 g.70404  ORF g.70404 m.70404 type:complete len:557 (-) comp14295_c0_seq1:76-1746(-)